MHVFSVSLSLRCYSTRSSGFWFSLHQALQRLPWLPVYISSSLIFSLLLGFYTLEFTTIFSFCKSRKAMVLPFLAHHWNVIIRHILTNRKGNSVWEGSQGPQFWFKMRVHIDISWKGETTRCNPYKKDFKQMSLSHEVGSTLRGLSGQMTLIWYTLRWSGEVMYVEAQKWYDLTGPVILSLVPFAG